MDHTADTAATGAESKSGTAPAWLAGCIVLLGLTGAWVSGQMLKQQAGLWEHDAGTGGLFARVCQASQQVGFTCDAPLKGRWANLPFPVVSLSVDQGIDIRKVYVPVAFVGLAYFVFMACWFGFVGGPAPHSRRYQRLASAVAIGGGLASLFYLSLMVTRQSPWCFWCLTVHSINFILIACVWRVHRRSAMSSFATPSGVDASSLAARNLAERRQIATVIAFWAILVAGLWVYRADHLALVRYRDKLLPYKATVEAMQSDSAFLMREFLVQQAHEIPAREGEDAADGQPELVVFTDFECPSCRCNSLGVQEQAIQAFEGRLRVRIRHFPLSGGCNPAVTSPFHANACDAARAAEAARLQGGDPAFWQMHSLLFQNRGRLSPHLYVRLAAEIGLDIDRFERDRQGDSVSAIVAGDIALGQRLGVSGTPTLFFNGRQVTHLCQTETFWRTMAQHTLPADPRPMFTTADAPEAQLAARVSAGDRGENRP